MSDTGELKAVRLLSGGDPKAARKLFLNLADQHPSQRPYYLCWAAYASIQMENHDTAVNDFENAIRFDETMFSQLHFANYLIDTKSIDAAKEQLENASRSSRYLLRSTPGERYESRYFAKTEARLAALIQ